MPISLGALHKVIDRVSLAIGLHAYDEAIAEVACHTPVGYIDETP
jgi:hypothetical protein